MSVSGDYLKGIEEGKRQSAEKVHELTNRFNTDGVQIKKLFDEWVAGVPEIKRVHKEPRDIECPRCKGYGIARVGLTLPAVMVACKVCEGHGYITKSEARKLE